MSPSSAAILHIVTDHACEVFDSALIQYFLRQFHYTTYTAEHQFKILVPKQEKSPVGVVSESNRTLLLWLQKHYILFIFRSTNAFLQLIIYFIG